MTNAIISPVSASAAAIVFTVKDGDIVVATVAPTKNHPPKGVLVVIPGNESWAFLPNGCIAGKNEAEKTARRAVLLANVGSEIKVAVIGEPTVTERKGKPAGNIKVSEQRAVMVAEKAVRAAQASERAEAIAATVASLVVGSIVEGTVTGPASKDSDRNPGTKHIYGAFIRVADGVSGLLHVKQIEGGDRGLADILAKGKAKVEIQDASMVDGQPRISLSQKSVGEKALVTWAMDRLGKKVKGKVVKTGEMAGNLHGRIIELLSGDKVFLADDDMNVKSETSLARNNTTTVIITDEIVDGMVRVTRRGV
jgi:predicted RNA-binding protein with RPS1 domain